MLLRILGTLVLGSTVVFASSNDYYNLLGVKKNATQKEIKKAYRAKAKEYHPDTSQLENATDLFKDVAAAYEVLVDPETRQVYDRHGKDGVEKMGQGGSRQGGGDAHFHDFFSQFGFGGGGQRRQREHITEIPLLVTLEQLYNGTEQDLSVEVETLCPKSKKCEQKRQECAGPGQIKEIVKMHFGGGVQITQSIRNDPTCVAQGVGWKPNCSDCPKGMYTRSSQGVFVEVPPGTKDGQTFRFPGMGRERVGEERGSIVVQLIQAPHPVYEPQNNDLLVKATISLTEALTGFEMQLPNPSGDPTPVMVKCTTPVSYGESLVLKGMGMPYGSGRGDIVVTFGITFPTELSASTATKLKELLDSDVKTWKQGYCP